MLERVRISTKLTILVAIPLASLVLLGLVAAQTLQQVRIGGQAYADIIGRKDLVADVQPPPLSLAEANLDVHRLALRAGDPTTDRADVERLRSELDTLEARYEERLAFWSARLDPANTATTILLVDSDARAQEFWTGYHDRFLPALDRVMADPATSTVSGANPLASELATLDDAFGAHRDTVVELVGIAGRDLEAQEQAALDLTRSQALVLAGAGLAIIAIVAAAGLLVARSISRPIRALTSAANDAATSGLGELVDTVRDLPTGAPLPEVAPFTVRGGEDLKALSASFDSLRSTAVGLAAGEAQLRQNVSAMFVNLGRRNQNLLNRTLNFITTLEQHERNPEALDNLFRLDHLVTRMRRNAESLLVLAGTDAPRTWSEPVDIGDIVRGALSEIEAYDRIEISALEPVDVRGNAAADVSHLLAEVLENATTFSPPSAEVTVVGMVCPDGYLVSVTDSGIGMTGRELDDANARLGEPTKFDTSPLMVLGLFVVSRLARRHGIAVSLTDSPTEGVTAKIRLPFELLEGLTAPVVVDAPSSEVDTEVDMAAELAVGLISPPELAPEVGAPLPIPASRPELDRMLGTDHGLTRRQRGAQMPDTGPDVAFAEDLPDPERTPDAVRSALSAFQSGTQFGLQLDPAAVAPPAAAPPPVAMAPPEPAPRPVVTAPAPDGDEDAGVLTRRVRGAQLFTSGGDAGEGQNDRVRSADHVKRALSSFKLGQAMAETETAGNGAPSEGEG